MKLKGHQPMPNVRTGADLSWLYEPWPPPPLHTTIRLETYEGIPWAPEKVEEEARKEGDLGPEWTMVDYETKMRPDIYMGQMGAEIFVTFVKTKKVNGA